MPRKKKPAIDYGERRQELIELLDSISKSETTPARYRIEAIKQLNELLSQAEEIKQAKIEEAERAELAKQREAEKIKQAKIREAERAKLEKSGIPQSQSVSDHRREDQFFHHKRLIDLQWELRDREELTKLLNKRGFTKSLNGLTKEQKEAKQRNLWGMVYPDKPFPDKDSELKTWYENFLVENSEY